MKRFAAIAITLAVALAQTPAEAIWPNLYLRPNRRSELHSWHTNYAYTAYGAPVALVAPPTANLQTNWSWGAPSMHISHLDQQFGRNYPGPGPFGGAFRYTPHWPSDMKQFGVNYVRAPWHPTQR